MTGVLAQGSRARGGCEGGASRDQRNCQRGEAAKGLLRSALAQRPSCPVATIPSTPVQGAPREGHVRGAGSRQLPNLKVFDAHSNSFVCGYGRLRLQLLRLPVARRAHLQVSRRLRRHELFRR